MSIEPQIGDIWEWREEDWYAIVMLVERDEHNSDNWYTMCLETDSGLARRRNSHMLSRRDRLLMSMGEAYMWGWRKIA